MHAFATGISVRLRCERRTLATTELRSSTVRRWPVSPRRPQGFADSRRQHVRLETTEARAGQMVRSLQPPTREAGGERREPYSGSRGFPERQRPFEGPMEGTPTSPHTEPYGARPQRVTNPPEATLAARTCRAQGSVVVRRARRCHSSRARTVSVAPPRARGLQPLAPLGQAAQEPRAVIRRPDACPPDIAPGPLAPPRFSLPAFEGKVQCTP